MKCGNTIECVVGDELGQLRLSTGSSFGVTTSPSGGRAAGAQQAQKAWIHRDEYAPSAWIHATSSKPAFNLAIHINLLCRRGSKQSRKQTIS